MYFIKRNTTLPKTLRGPFFDYEKARSAIRKWLRAKYQNTYNNIELTYSHGNAAISDFGFKIERV